MMKLYSGDLSPYSARVRMQIYAKGITDITLERPPHFGTPKFREEYPIGRIPVLDIDGDMMPESEVIAEYLEEVYPQPSMLGATPRETAHIRTRRPDRRHLPDEQHVHALAPEPRRPPATRGSSTCWAARWCATSRRWTR